LYAGGRGADGGPARQPPGGTIGIDYSGAETPTGSRKGLRVYLAEGVASPVEVPPRKYWTRKGIGECITYHGA
jgi:hypothetical protein